MKYEIMPSASLSQIEERINSVFHMGKTCRYTSTQITEMLIEQVIKPLQYRTASGKLRHSVWVQGYAAGVIAACRTAIWRNDVEFCYLVDGVLYSTQKDSAHRKIEEFYAREEGHILSKHEGMHYWKGTDKPY